MNKILPPPRSLPLFASLPFLISEYRRKCRIVSVLERQVDVRERCLLVKKDSGNGRVVICSTARILHKNHLFRGAPHCVRTGLLIKSFVRRCFQFIYNIFFVSIQCASITFSMNLYTIRKHWIVMSLNKEPPVGEDLKWFPYY